MTWYKPTLRLNKLAIIKSGQSVYEESFHAGLNVIRGTNSSGKTTISKAIIYALGGEIKELAPQLRACDFVIAEVLVNNEFITLRRPVSSDRSNHMEIFWGKYDIAIESDISTWEKYPYANYENKLGFSRVLFNSLGLPEVKGYQASNITMHQILRLMYGDQSSPSNKLLSSEDFDSTITREAIGDLLCGIYDDDLFNARVEITKTDKELSAKISQLKSLYQVIGKQQSDIKSIDIDSEIKATETKLEDLEKGIRDQKSIDQLTDDDPKNLKIKKTLKKRKETFYETIEQKTALEFDISDSELFIAELNHKISCLDDSISVTEIVNDISFKNCPSCFSDLRNLERTEDQCTLCGSDIKHDSSKINLHKVRNEIELQIKESSTLLLSKNGEFSDLSSLAENLEIEIKNLTRQYKDVATDITSQQQKMLEKMYREIGYLECTVEELQRNKEIIEQISEIASERDRLQSRLFELREFVEAKENNQQGRREVIALELSNETVKLLKQDLSRQDQFSNARKVGFDFGTNSISVDNETTFSESSTVYLKNAFLLAMLSVSAADDKLRFPRFLLLDGIENGGMERERSHNLQKVILGLSDSLDVDHQIIITTAEIAPELEVSAAPVGRFYTTDNKSLEFSSNNSVAF